MSLRTIVTFPEFQNIEIIDDIRKQYDPLVKLVKPHITLVCPFESQVSNDDWREECWLMMKERSDCTFLFLRKRIERFMECIPDNWGNGYENVVVCCTIENQKNADKKLVIFQSLPIIHKCITAQPLLEGIDIEQYLENIELVVVGGESDYYARSLNYDWVLDIREQCIRKMLILNSGNVELILLKKGKRINLQG